MDARWRNLSLIAVAIVVAIAAYFLLPSLVSPVSLSFDAGLSELNSIWVAEGVSFFMSDSELEQIPKQKIVSLKSKTTAFRELVSGQPSSDNSAALLALTNIYTVRLDVFLALKELDEAEAVYTFTGNESDEEVCAKVFVLDDIQNSLVALLQKLVGQNSKIDSFESSFPAQFEKADLAKSTAKIAEVEQTIQSNALLIAEIKEGCA